VDKREKRSKDGMQEINKNDNAEGQKMKQEIKE
jgi:hypothetical protein